MEEKHDIVAPVFKAKGKPVSKAKISSRPVVKMKGKHRITTRIEKERPAQHISLMLRRALACFIYDIGPGLLLPMAKSPQYLYSHGLVSDQKDT